MLSGSTPKLGPPINYFTKNNLILLGYTLLKNYRSCQTGSDFKGLGYKTKQQCAQECGEIGAKYFTHALVEGYCRADTCLCWCQLMIGSVCNAKYWSNDALYKIDTGFGRCHCVHKNIALEE